MLARKAFLEVSPWDVCNHEMPETGDVAAKRLLWRDCECSSHGGRPYRPVGFVSRALPVTSTVVSNQFHGG